MRISLPFFRIVTALLLIAYALPSLADIASPQRTLRKRQLQEWRQQFPNSRPSVDCTLAPDGKAFLVNLTFKTPASYEISLVHEKQAAKAEGRVDELAGGVRTERISVSPPPDAESSWLFVVNYRLKGVEDTPSGPRPTDKTITARSVKRFSVTWSGGRAKLREDRLDASDYFLLQRDNEL